jgi:hypothetical protein
MRRRLFNLLTVLSLLLCVAVAALWVRGRSVSGAIAEVASSGGELDLARVANFDWDKVYFFCPYTPGKYVEDALGFEWPSLGGSDIESSDGVTLVVFVKHGRVVKSFDHRRSDGDFLPVAPGIGDTNDGFTKAEAKFVVRREEGWPVVYFADRRDARMTPTTAATQP